MKSRLLLLVLLFFSAHCVASVQPGCKSLEAASKGGDGEQATAKQRSYAASLRAVHALYCHNSLPDAAEGTRAVEAVAQAWWQVWQQEPFDAEFHERGAFDLLAVMSVSSRMPEAFRRDSHFFRAWTTACDASCFTLFATEDDTDSQQLAIDQLLVRNRILSHLKNDSPEAAQLIAMLRRAEFRLVE